jgi:hypothetical protein
MIIMLSVPRWMLFFAAFVLGAISARAQNSPGVGSGFTLGTGVIVAPNPEGGQCGRGGTGGFEAKAGVIFRPRRPWVVEMDARSAYLFETGCAGVGVPVDTDYFVPPHNHYFNSTLRVGVETPARFPLIRLTAGAGVFLAGRASPFAVFDAAWSTRGPRARFFAEAQKTLARVDGVEERYSYTGPATTSPLTGSLKTYSVRIGMEFPFARRQDAP